MRLTKNTNKTIRTWVDSILNQLDLVICESNYREVYKKLSMLRRCECNKNEIIESLTCCEMCISKFKKELRQNLRGGNINLDRI